MRRDIDCFAVNSKFAGFSFFLASSTHFLLISLTKFYSAFFDVNETRFSLRICQWLFMNAILFLRFKEATLRFLNFKEAGPGFGF